MPSSNESESHVKTIFRALAHELRGSIGACASFAEIIKHDHQDKFDEQTLRRLDMMTLEYAKAKQILQEMSSYAKFLDIKVDTAECSLAAIASSALLECNGILVQEGSATSQTASSVLLDVEGNALVNVNSDLLYQFLLEVLLNSVRHAVPKNYLHEPAIIRCHLNCEVTTEGFTLCLTDNGHLLTENALDFMQKPFKTLKNSRALYNSAGLGLSKLLRIADLLNGTLSFGIGKGEYAGLQVMLKVTSN